MSFCDYAKGDAVLGHTTLSNIFIMEYLPAAPSDYVKVYLFGLLLCRHDEICDSMEAMAERLHLDINTVKNAFAYWEREGAVIKLSDNPPSYSFVTLAPSQSQNEELDDDVYSNRDYIRTLQALMPSLVMENHEIRIANDWLDVFGLDKDSVYYLIKNEVARRGEKLPSAKTMFKHLNDTVKKWAEAGVHDVKSAQDFVARDSSYFKTAQAVVERFNQKRMPTSDEIDLVRRWMEEMGYSQEKILSACSEMTRAERPSFKYLDSILENRRTNPDDGLREKVKKINAHLGISSVPSPEQAEALKRFLDMGFEFEAIEQAAGQCGMKNRRRYEDIENQLGRWKEAGVFTVADIEKERELRKIDSDFAYRVFENAGIDKKVTDADIKSVRVWKALMAEDAVLYAATLAHGTDAPIKYIDKIVKSWSARGITTLEKAKEAQPATGDKARGAQNNPSKIMDERDLKDEDFADWFRIDLKNR